MESVAAPWRTATLGQSTSTAAPAGLLPLAGGVEDLPNSHPPSLSVMESSAWAGDITRRAHARIVARPAEEAATEPITHSSPKPEQRPTSRVCHWTLAAPRHSTRAAAVEPREQQMILPQAVDAEIFACIAFAREAHFFQKPDRGGIGGNASRFQPVKTQRSEGERHQSREGAGHQAAAREGLADPVAEAAGLRDAAPDVGQRQAADQCVVGLAEQEER